MQKLTQQHEYIEQLKTLVGQSELGNEIVNTYADDLQLAFRIRTVENAFLKLFSEGRMNGTVHTCVGQELTGVAVCKFLHEQDWVTSNHRCHGHFISKTNRWESLIDELMGLASGICGGIGSSQHLFTPGFISNGTQGSLLPVASGIGHTLKRKNNGNVVVSFIGEGTLGEGNVYEAMNLSATLSLPHVIVCENNYYSQSTPQGANFAGNIKDRANGFGFEYFETNTWDLNHLFATCEQAIKFARKNCLPVFLSIKTYRLNAHSKGDDDRDTDEVKFFFENDVLEKVVARGNLDHEFNIISSEVNEYVQTKIGDKQRYNISKYILDQLPRKLSTKKQQLQNPKIKMVKALREAIRSRINAGAFIIGEDIHDPYGGAFKVTLGLDEEFPGQVISSPISEAAITGFGIGKSMLGAETYVEIMFGDFIMNSMDQIVNNASKFFHMYAQQTGTSLVIRTPMGGGRGYGPTHSQSLEKLLLGIDNLAVYATTSMIDPTDLIEHISSIKSPSVLIESKTDYGQTLFSKKPDFPAEFNIIGGSGGTLLMSPWAQSKDIDMAVLTYGKLGRLLADNYLEIFQETDVLFDLFVVQQLHPVPTSHLLQKTKIHKKLLVIEEGSADFGWGAGVLAKMMAELPGISGKTIGALPVPIPSERSLEDDVLVGLPKVISGIKGFK